jgi:Dynamin family
MAQAAAAAPAAPAPPGPEAALVELVKVLQKLDRPDLAGRASAAAARLKRPSTIVCVVGEFKQGKSSLVNGLLGQQVCPVDDDLATSAITLVKFGEQAGAVVRRKDAEPVAIPIAELGEWVSEIGNPGNGKGVERVEISAPAAILKQGLVLVDTPGMGGLGAGHAAATLSFLPFADGLIFVSDASAELSAPEVDFLRRATELCPTVMFAQTKVDLYPHWQRIVELNKGHLDRQGVKLPVVPVSSALRTEALARKNRELNELSAFPALVKSLGDDVVAPAKANAAKRSAADGRSITGLVRGGLESEKSILGNPEAAKAAGKKLEEAKARLDHLRGPGAKWNVLVGDRVADLSTTVNFRFRQAMRGISRSMDERIEVLGKGDEWDDMAHDLQSAVADEVTNAFIALEEGRQAIRQEVVELIAEEHLQLNERGALGASFDVDDFWQGKSLDDNKSMGKKAFGTGITTVRGAQGGIMMFGMLGQFLPTAASLLLASNPVLLGIGALFGGMGLADDRKRKVTMRRQAARTQVRQFVDDVQFEVGNQIGNLVRDVQRELRDEFTERLGELQRTYTDAATRAQEDAKRTTAERQQRGAEIDAMLKALAGVESQLAAVK